MIVSSGDLLLTVVNDVLDYSKLESGNVEIDVRRSNLQETLNAIVHSIQTKAASKQISLRTYFDPAVPEFCHTDSQRLQQILYNLLGNAIKFSPTDSPVELGVLLCPLESTPRPGEYYPGSVASETSVLETTTPINTPVSDADEDVPPSTPLSPLLHNRKSYARQFSSLSDESMVLRFVVKDYGQGLRPEDYKRIFEPFQQASRETEQVYGGTGLGLAITAKLVYALGGTISVASERGAWTRFTVDIPFGDSPVPLVRFSRNLARATVLLVGPDCPVRAQVCHYLDAFGAPHLVFDTSAALRKAVSEEESLHKRRAYICLVQEDNYEEETYALVSNSAKAVLLTYGPKFSVPESSGHFRSLCQVLPSVLVKVMLSALKHRQAQGQQIVTHQHQPSFSGIHAMYHDYRILVAEDNQVNQKVLLRMLNRIGIQHVRVVSNGLLAVEADRAESYDIILMDMQMPVLDGIEACKRILARRDRGEERPPSIVFVTANVSPSFEMACNDAGGSGFLTKPFNIPELENTLRKTYLMREMEHGDDTSENTEM